MCANSEGSGETARMPEHSLVTNVISTLISCAGSFILSVEGHVCFGSETDLARTPDLV